VTGTLKFTGPLLADIFLGKITKWNDPAIAKVNAGVTLRTPTSPSRTARTAAVRHTFLWIPCEDIAGVEVEDRCRNCGKLPVGLGGKGNDGVTSLVKQTPGTIGYVELIYALQNKMPYGSVQNMSGEFITASVEAVTAAAAEAANKCPPISVCRLPTLQAKACIPSRRLHGFFFMRIRKKKRWPGRSSIL